MNENEKIIKKMEAWRKSPNNACGKIRKIDGLNSKSKKIKKYGYRMYKI